MKTSDLPLPLCVGEGDASHETFCFCADGSAKVLRTIVALNKEPEPFGETDFLCLRDQYASQGRRLRADGAECLLLHGFGSLGELRAAVLGCRDLGVPVMASMVSDESGETPCGEDVAACFVVLQDLGLFAFGLTGLDPFAMKPLYTRLREYGKIPLLALPECPPDMSPARFADGCEGLMRRSVTVLGQSGSGKKHTGLLRRMMESFDITVVAVKQKIDDQEVLLASQEIHYLDTDLEYSPPVQCSLDMSDELLEVTKEACDAVLVEVDTPDDGYLFAQNAHMVDLPVAFQSESLAALQDALLYYNGKAILRSTEVQLAREELESLAAQYGAVVL